MDYQASTPADPRVVEAMAPFYHFRFGNPHSADHAYGWDADAAVEDARLRLGQTIGADPDEVVWTSGATEANNIAVIGTVWAAPSERRRIIVSAIEHKCVLGAAYWLQEQGFEVVTIPVNPDGVIDLAAAATLIDERTALVSVMMMNNEIGTAQPIEAVAAMAHAAGAPFHTDAAQALAVQTIDVHTLGIDLLSLSGHKIYGPKGIGGLFVSRNLFPRPRPLFHGGGQEGGLRPGTVPVPLCIGLAAACDLLAAERESDVTRLRRLRDSMMSGLRAAIPDMELNGAEDGRHPANLNIRVPGIEAGPLLSSLQPDLAVSTGSACTSGIPEPSHVLRALGRTAIQANESIRISLGRFTTEAEVEAAISLISKVVESLRQGLPG